MRSLATQGFGLILLLFASQAWSIADQLSYHIHPPQLLMSAQVDMDLPEEIRQAIEHEIPILFKTQIQLEQQSQFLFFRSRQKQVDISYLTELSYSHFYQRYTLHNLRNNNRLHFSSLDNALQTLGRFDDFLLADLNQLHAGLNYSLKLRISVDWLQLPAPILSHALFNRAWFYNTGWLVKPIAFRIGE
ncbi:DUF4390 domain-containing protein [Thiomicrospira microaerophila]|uniref:DUF4390 domain-containing protein n=1 Tax=Thiomicrospira microaerophila TaxID=406020 RepID=UPI00200BA333|nr:DUF4390 domain-containing protein [Thiomicrospira microaerophila]UQB42049.1 DUF4390 domain-containing protein [Thiomicrospira microaerophila]